jgi:phospholipase/carboxylesterase
MHTTTLALPLSLPCLARRPAAPDARPPALVLLHGYGSNEHDLFGLAPWLDERFWIVSPRAPVTLAPGSYAWFNLEIDGGILLADEEQMERSRQALVRLIAELPAACGIDPGRVFVLGFSQGACLSLSLLLSAPELLAGGVAMSGFLMPETRAAAVPPARLAGRPVMVVHGDQDPLVPVEQGRDIRDYLAATPAVLTYREYPMGHQIAEDALDDVSQWLSGNM